MVRKSGENITLRTPGIASRERASGDGIDEEVFRNSIVGVLGGSRECSVGINLRAWSFGVGEVCIKTVRRDVARIARGEGRVVGNVR
jgi:hypothetical protein